MKILISGGEGLLAQELIKTNILHTIYAPNKTTMNICSSNSINEAFSCFKPEILIHCAALTTPMILHDENPFKSIETNIEGTCKLVKECILLKTKIVYISTDYVYPGDTGMYSEEHALNPINKYAWSKLGGECAVKIANGLILRCSFTSRPFKHEKAFNNSYKSFLYVDEIAPIIWKIINSNITNDVINVGGNRKSIYEFALESNHHVQSIDRLEIGDWVPKDTSFNLTKLRKIL